MDTKLTEVRLGRNFVRVGDTVKVKLPGKKQFSSGWKVREIEARDGEPLLRVVDGGGWHWRYVPLSSIKRVAQTKNGERVR